MVAGLPEIKAHLLEELPTQFLAWELQYISEHRVRLTYKPHIPLFHFTMANFHTEIFKRSWKHSLRSSDLSLSCRAESLDPTVLGSSSH